MIFVVNLENIVHEDFSSLYLAIIFENQKQYTGCDPTPLSQFYYAWGTPGDIYLFVPREHR